MSRILLMSLFSCVFAVNCFAEKEPWISSDMFEMESPELVYSCMYDLDNDGWIGQSDLSIFGACYGDYYVCYPEDYMTGDDDCCACNFDESYTGHPSNATSFVGPGDFSGFSGCFGLRAVDCNPCHVCDYEYSSLGNLTYADVAEASGLVASRNHEDVLWTHDDSGGRLEIFAINVDGTLLGTYSMGTLIPEDAEDIALGRGPGSSINYIYFGDIGDNSNERSTIIVYRAPEPAVVSTQSYTYEKLDNVEAFAFRYPSGVNAPSHKDSEAMFVDGYGNIYFITKRISPQKLYVAYYSEYNKGDSVTTLTYLRDLPTGTEMTKITGADISANGNEIILVQDRTGTLQDYATLWLDNDGDIKSFFDNAPCIVPLQHSPQGEAITFLPYTLSFYTVSEAYGGVSQPVFRYDVNSAY